MEYGIFAFAYACCIVSCVLCVRRIKQTHKENEWLRKRLGGRSGQWQRDLASDHIREQAIDEARKGRPFNARDMFRFAEMIEHDPVSKPVEPQLQWVEPTFQWVPPAAESV